MALYTTKKYIEIIDIMIPDIVSKYNEILLIKIDIDVEKI